MQPIQDPKKANSDTLDWHYADVQAALKKAGWTYRKLSASSGYSNIFARVARDIRSVPIERIIAQALGLKPEQIWPSRYRGDRRIYRDRWGPQAERHGTHRSKPARERNVSETPVR